MHKLTALVPKCYLGVGLVISIFVIVSEWTATINGHAQFPVFQVFVSIFWTIFSFFCIFAYPWVRINIFGDIDHPLRVLKKYDRKAEKNWNAADIAYQEAPNEYHTTFHVTDYDISADTRVDDRLKRKAETPFQVKALLIELLSLLLGVFIYFVDFFLWIACPILIWFSLGKKTLAKAANLGYLKPKYYNGEQ